MYSNILLIKSCSISLTTITLFAAIHTCPELFKREATIHCAARATSASFKTINFSRIAPVTSNTSVILPPVTIVSNGYGGGTTTGSGHGSVTVPTFASNTYIIVTVQRATGSTDTFSADWCRIKIEKA